MSGPESLPHLDRLALSQALAKLPDPQFKQVVFAIQPPPGILPADSSPLGDRVASLLQWVENNGPGLAVLQRVLAQITGAAISPPEKLPEPVQPQPTLKPDPTYPCFSFEVVTVNPQGQILGRREPIASLHQPVPLARGVTLDMVLVPGGTFMMGSPKNELERNEDEGPQHQVTLPRFWMGIYLVTQAQYQAIMGNNPSNFKGNHRPVESVTWNDAVEFCDRLSQKLGQPYTLPSETQWEYACRAGTTTPFHFGETITTDLANYNGNYTYSSGPKGTYRQETTDVGSFPPNGFGLYDMHGNVWEWCYNRWHDSHHFFTPADGSAWATGGNSMLRGGSWYSYPSHCRCAYRFHYLNPDNSCDFNNGFRVVTDHLLPGT